MSTKDFKAGMVAGAKPFGDKLEQLADVSENAIGEMKEGIEGVSNVVNVILDDLTIQEKKNIYDLNTPAGIAILNQTEKEYLLAVLFTIAESKEELNDYQRFYLRSLKSYLEIVDVQSGIDLSTIENIESISTQKALLQTIMEFLYLEYQNHDYMDDYKELIDYFSVNKRGIAELKSAVDHMASLMGMEGIACHYSPLVEPVEETKAVNIEKVADIPEHYGLIYPVEDEMIIDDSNRDIPVGSEKVFENLRIIVAKQLHVDGRAVFKNCEIVMDYSGRVAILLRYETSCLEFVNCEFKTGEQAKLAMIDISDGECKVRNCKFDGMKYQYGLCDNIMQDEDGEFFDYNRSYIDINGYEQTATLLLEHCLIEDCEGTFINADGNAEGDNHKVIINECLINNHVGNFLLSRYANQGSDTGVLIKKTTFSNIKAYNQAEDYDFRETNFLDLIHISSTKFEITESSFLDIDENVFCIKDTFRNAANCKIEKCKISNCRQSETIISIFNECEFESITTDNNGMKIGNCTSSGSPIVVISNSLFKNFNGKLIIEHGKIEHCSFEDSTITVELQGRTGNNPFISEANDLTFINCTAIPNKGYDFMDASCFLQATSYMGKAGICVLFRGCKFENCKTMGAYINTEKKEFGAFNRIKTIELGRETGTIIK